MNFASQRNLFYAMTKQLSTVFAQPGLNSSSSLLGMDLPVVIPGHDSLVVLQNISLQVIS
jgi:hypothetical protein